MVSPLLVNGWFTLKPHEITKDGANSRLVHCPTILLFMLRQLILGFKREGHLGALINSRLGHR